MTSRANVADSASHTPMSMVLRPAELLESDADAFAHYVEMAADGLFAMLLGRAAARILRNVTLIPGHNLSLEHARFVSADGVTVGMVHSMSGVDAAREAPLLRSAGLRAIRAVALEVVGRPLFRALARHEPSDLYVQAIAVEPSARGRGLGTLLLSDAERQARAFTASAVTLWTWTSRIPRRSGSTSAWASASSLPRGRVACSAEQASTGWSRRCDAKRSSPLSPRPWCRPTRPSVARV